MSTLKAKAVSKSEYHHGNLIHALKKQAIKMIKQKGITQVSLRSLADKCDVSPTAIYRHYKSKEHLFAEIAQDGFNELKQAMSEAKQPHKLQNIGIAYINFALSNPVKFQLMFSVFIEKNKYPLLFQASMDAYHILRDEIEESRKIGTMRGDLDSLSRTAWSTVHGAAILLLDNQFPAPPNNPIDKTQIVTEITTILEQGLFIKSPSP